MSVVEERGKPEYPEKNLSVQSREPTNSTTYDAESGNRTRATLRVGELPACPMLLKGEGTESVLTW